ncbi:MAG: hypothetical protein EPO02_13215 [Nitrospirae bacterium]|nr:MAG: hypothetical protein EPO02_13215 [Nitrospirota bacterium]
MANSGNSIKLDEIREIAAGSLTTSYQNLGGILLRDAYRIWITNNTNGDVYLSINGGLFNQMKVRNGSGRAYDNKTNDSFFGANTQFKIKWDVAPGAPAGWFSLEVEYV